MIGGTRKHAQRVVIVYGGMTVLGVAGCLLAGTGFVNAIEYTFSSVSTGGFAPTDASIAGLGLPAQLWIHGPQSVLQAGSAVCPAGRHSPGRAGMARGSAARAGPRPGDPAMA
jgi:hypothetical protein